VNQLQELNRLFAEAFDDDENYQNFPPSDSYLNNLLSKENFLCLVALDKLENQTHREILVGGLVAYVLEKFEQERKEIYIYDLAPKYQQPSQLAATTEIKPTRTRRTKAEIEAAKVEPVLPDFCVNGQECSLPVALTFEPEAPEVITSAATTTKARRFGRTAPVEVETTDDSNDSEVA
jgi:hypothetical protein